MSKEVPLRDFDGKVIGSAKVEETDKGLSVTAEITDPKRAAELGSSFSGSLLEFDKVDRNGYLFQREMMNFNREGHDGH